MIGQIVLWSGAIIDIPAGWSLCDGTGSTPDLRSKFVQGAGGLLAPGDTGGQAEHAHQLLSATNTPVSTGAAFVVEGFTEPETSLPPYHALAYIQHTS